ncbi:MAG: ABC transporter C-terminal domain-containing protein [Spirochaetaceae bacterium]
MEDILSSELPRQRTDKAAHSGTRDGARPNAENTQNRDGRGHSGRLAAGARAGQNPARGHRNRSVKLGFKERRELDELPDRISAPETEQRELHARLSAPALYRESDAWGTSARVRDRRRGFRAHLG